MSRTIRILAFLLCWLLVGTVFVFAQDAAPTNTPLGPVFVPSPTFTLVPTPVITPTPPTDDPRIGVCSAPFQPGWSPYRIYRNDRLADLLVGVEGLTVAQVAALNCLDDSAALPAGAVIWLPPGVANKLAHPAPQDSSPGVDRATITSFTASASQVQNVGQGVTFSWQAEGTAAYFYVCPPAAESTCERPLSAQPVPLTYTTPPITGFRYASKTRYRLEVVDGKAVASQDVSFEVVCTYEAMGEVSGFHACPLAPIEYVFVAYESFEHGAMMWLSDTKQIWVMMEDHHLQIYGDRFQEGDPAPPFTAPPGKYTPQRGFGRLWQDLGGPNSPLGWALGKEGGYDAGRQPAGEHSYTTYMGGPISSVVYAITLIPGTTTGYWYQVR